MTDWNRPLAPGRVAIDPPSTLDAAATAMAEAVADGLGTPLRHFAPFSRSRAIAAAKALLRPHFDMPGSDLA